MFPIWQTDRLYIRMLNERISIQPNESCTGFLLSNAQSEDIRSTLKLVRRDFSSPETHGDLNAHEGAPRLFRLLQFIRMPASTICRY